jgi:hypothetical protein
MRNRSATLTCGEAYLVARFSSGGVVVDLGSGNYFRANRSGVTVCEILQTCDEQSVAELRIAEALGISVLEARDAVANVVAALASGAMRGTPQGSFHFFSTENGYKLRHGSRYVLEVRGENAAIRLPIGGQVPTPAVLELYVRALAPKLLFQQGITVLHASACLAKGRLIAFAGLSGAGKTTTAHAFVQADARLVSEDLLLLSPGDAGAKVILEGESAVRAWAQSATAELIREPECPIPPISVGEVSRGPRAPLDRILFLDRLRRIGSEFTTQELAEPDALIALMMHDFLGAAEPAACRRFLGDAAALVASVDTMEASAPRGTQGLALAARRYMSSWTS